MTDSSGTPQSARPLLRSTVVGVDGSESSKLALAWACARAGEIAGTVTAVHVLTYSREFLRDLPPTGITRWRHELELELQGPWTELGRSSGVIIRTELVEDDSAAAGLAAAADRIDADLLVVGAHGDGNLADRMLGSTSYKLTHRANQPVVVVPRRWRPPQG
jgi:nucleotide-binding universal stress UspA family protein